MVLKSLLDVIHKKSGDNERIDAAMGARFLIETFRKDLGDSGREQIAEMVEKHIDAMSDASNSLKIQLMKNIEIAQISNNSVIEVLIINLASSDIMVRRTALEVLCEFGVTSSAELESRMNSLKMFPERFKGYTKFVHPLDVCKSILTKITVAINR